jgi:hypothetical protein
MDDRPRERIKKSTAQLMIGTVILLDLISLIPGANWVSGFGGIFIYPLWFLFHGIPFFKNPKILKGSIPVMLIEAIPFISIIPALSFGIIKTVLSIRKEDLEAIAAWENGQIEAQTEQRNKIAERREAYNLRINGSNSANNFGSDTRKNQGANNRRVDSIRRAA